MKILERTASDNQYLHKDFHGALAYAISYLDNHFGSEAIKEYLQQTARNAFSPLIESVKKDGLAALKKHYQDIFELEEGDFEISLEKNYLTITVNSCPAICHLRKTDMLYTNKFCLTTVIVNETISQEAGLEFDCEYNTSKGRCVQRFWRRK